MNRSSRIHDISQPVSERTGVWPGDTPFSATFTWKMDDGDSCNVSKVSTSPHVGTHADAPLHFLPQAPGIGEVDLESYVGPCWVVDGPRSGQVQIRHLEGVDLARFPRVLVRTRDDADVGFDEDFVSLSVAAAVYLKERGARLIGLDTPSMDPFDSKELPAHHLLLEGRIALLENLQLSEVSAGPYELIALPLRWPGLDASPVRAVLRELG